MTHLAVLGWGNYAVQAINPETEPWNTMKPSAPLLSSLGRHLLSNGDAPDLVLRRATRTDIGSWQLDPDHTIEVFMMGCAEQVCVARISKVVRDENDDCVDTQSDYYQVPYPEVAPRAARIIGWRSDKDANDRWFVADVTNKQLSEWLEENGALKWSWDFIAEHLNTPHLPDEYDELAAA